MKNQISYKLLGHIAMGRNPPAEKKYEALQGTTLEQAFNDFIAVRKNLKFALSMIINA